MSLEDEVVALLKDQGLTLTTAESCTACLLYTSDAADD